MDEKFATATIELERLRRCLSKAIDEAAFSLAIRPRCDIYRPENMYAVVIQLVADIWAQDVGRYEFKWPMDWWQAFRARWFPRWWLVRHPVMYRYKAFQVHAAYPTWRPPPGLDRVPFVWKVQEHDWDD